MQLVESGTGGSAACMALTKARWQSRRCRLFLACCGRTCYLSSSAAGLRRHVLTLPELGTLQYGCGDSPSQPVAQQASVLHATLRALEDEAGEAEAARLLQQAVESATHGVLRYKSAQLLVSVRRAPGWQATTPIVSEGSLTLECVRGGGGWGHKGCLHIAAADALLLACPPAYFACLVAVVQPSFTEPGPLPLPPSSPASSALLHCWDPLAGCPAAPAERRSKAAGPDPLLAAPGPSAQRGVPAAAARPGPAVDVARAAQRAGRPGAAARRAGA